MKAFDHLELPVSATPAEIRARFRELAAIHHPDRGGDAATFAAISRAYATALVVARQPVACTNCDGTGQTSRMRGWRKSVQPCPACQGAGVINPQD